LRFKTGSYTKQYLLRSIRPLFRRFDSLLQNVLKYYRFVYRTFKPPHQIVQTEAFWWRNRQPSRNNRPKTSTLRSTSWKC